jgi:hypothetical protein
VNDVQLLRAAFVDVSEPSAEKVAGARAALLDLIASDASQGRRARGTSWASAARVRLFRGSPRRLPVVLAVLIVLLVLAAIATATLGLHVWLSSAPGGVQFSASYRLSDVFSASEANGAEWSSFALSPAGHDVYALRTDGSGGHQEVMRVSGVDRGTRLRATRVLGFTELERPGRRVGSGGALAVAPGGDLVLVVPVADGGIRSLELVVMRPDGSRQVVVTSEDLVRNRLFPVANMTWQLAASASDRVWLAVGPAAGNGPQRLLEIVDPNADGDWSDRVVRPIALPASVPFARQATRPFTFDPEWPWRLVTEPGRTRSVLAIAVDSKTDEFRAYRITDRSPATAQLLLRRNLVAGDAPWVALTTRGLAIGGLTRGDRISLVSRSGAVTDIGRSFPLTSLLAGPDGVLYPITRTISGDRSRFVIYRLQPATGGATGSPVRGFVATATRPAVGRVPRLVFERGGSAFTVGADGTMPTRLLSDRHVYDVCESAEGSAVAYESDSQVPNEFFLYSASLSAGHARQLSQRQATGFGCPFATGRLLIFVPEGLGPAYTLLSHDVHTGRDAVVAEHVDRFALSPDGTKLAYIGGVRFNGDTRLASSRETLELVDLTTMQRTRLAGPLPSGNMSFGIFEDAFGLRWSPDSRRVEYVVEPSDPVYEVAHQSVLWVRDVRGRVLLRIPLRGGMPSAAWSPDSSRLLVCLENRGLTPSCPAGPGDRQDMHFARSTTARLLLLDLTTGERRVVARGSLLFAAWAPSGTAFAYATPSDLFLDTTGHTRRLARAPNGRWTGSFWPGFSPDGRYFALSAGPANAIPVVDVRSRRLRLLLPFGQRTYENVHWWR